MCGLSLLLVLFLAPRGFSPCTPVFPSPQKTGISKFQFDLDYCQALYHEPLARVIAEAEALPVFIFLARSSLYRTYLTFHLSFVQVWTVPEEQIVV